MRLFAKHEDGFREVPRKRFENEAELQALIEEHSNLLPLELDPRRRAIREFTTEAGPIDHLVIDAEGAIAVVETKLASNADRRTVIAQALDYAAQLTKYRPQGLLDIARQRLGSDFTEEWFDTREERESFLRELETNLRLGRLTLLVVMDRAEQLLKDAVRFVNRATHFSCLLAEITRVEVRGTTVVGFDVYGQEMVDEKEPPEPALGREEFIRLKAKAGMGDEARLFLDALALVAAEGTETSSSAAGFYLQGLPVQSNHYLTWKGATERVEIWASARDYEAVKAHLEAAPPPWPDRVATRPLRPDGNYGKVADVTVAGILDRADWLALFRHYLAAPTQPLD